MQAPRLRIFDPTIVAPDYKVDTQDRLRRCQETRAETRRLVAEAASILYPFVRESEEGASGTAD